MLFTPCEVKEGEEYRIMDEKARAKSDKRPTGIVQLRRTFHVDVLRMRWSDRSALGLDADAVEPEVIKPRRSVHQGGGRADAVGVRRDAVVYLETRAAGNSVLCGKQAVLV